MSRGERHCGRRCRRPSRSCRRLRNLDGDPKCRRGRPRHASERAAWRADEVDPVGEVKKAVDHPAYNQLRKRCVTRARQAEAGPGRDSQQVEVGIAHDLPEQLEHVRVERLRCRARGAGGVVHLTRDTHQDFSVESAQTARSGHDQVEGRGEGIRLPTEAAARHTGCGHDRDHLEIDLDGRPRRQSIDDHGGIDADIAIRARGRVVRGQICGARAVVGHDALDRIGCTRQEQDQSEKYHRSMLKTVSTGPSGVAPGSLGLGRRVGAARNARATGLGGGCSPSAIADGLARNQAWSGRS